MQTSQVASHEAHTESKPELSSTDPAQDSPPVPAWMSEGYWRGRGRAATARILADDALAHQESRMAMANN